MVAIKNRKIQFSFLCVVMLVSLLTGCRKETIADIPNSTPGSTQSSIPSSTPGSTPNSTPSSMPSSTPDSMPSGTPDSTPGSTQTEPDVELESEIAEAMELFEVPEPWIEELDAEVTCTDMTKLLESMLYARLEAPSEGTISWLNSSEWEEKSVCTRGQASVFIYRLALENYFGIEDASECYQYSPYDYMTTLLQYRDREGSGLTTLEHRMFHEGTLPEEDAADFDVWSSVYCTAQVDLTNRLPIMDVDENNSLRCSEPITRREAIISCKRLYNAYMDNTLVPLSAIGKLEFSKEQLEQAAHLPAASWNELPAWSGLSNSLGGTGRYVYESDFALMQKYGFNFCRILIGDDNFQWNGEEMAIPQWQLDNFDALMNWAIEYEVHVCLLVDEEGYRGASMDISGFYDEELTDRLIQCYTMLAKRYGALPNNVFSLNIFNEPWQLSLVEEDFYVSKVREVLASIREYGEDRLIFVDGLGGSQQPVYSLFGDHVAMSAHMYGPDSLYTAGWDYNAWWYAGQQYPCDFVTGYLFSSGEGYTFEGDFPAGTQVQMLLNRSDESNGELKLYADGVLVGELPIDSEHQQTVLEYSPLTSETKELVIEWSGTTGVGVRNIAIVYPEKGEKPVPRVCSPWYDGKQTDVMCENKVVQIVCEMDFAMDGEYQNPVITITDDGRYTVTHDGDKRYTYGKEYYSAMLSDWVIFSEETGIAIMVQEWGPYADKYISQEAAIGVTVAGAQAMQEAGFPWCSSALMLNTEKLDIEPLVDGTYRINTEMIEALQSYMTIE